MSLQPKPISPTSWRSLQTRITLLTLAVFLSLLWSLSWYAERALRRDVEQLLGQQQLTTVTLQAGDLNRTLAARLKTLEEVGQLAVPMMSRSPAELQNFLATRLTLVNFFNGGMMLLDTDGYALAAYPSMAPRQGVNYRDRQAAGQALKEGRSAIGKPMVSPESKTPIVPFATPMRNAAGQIVGAMVGLVNLGEPNFMTPLLSSRYGQSGRYVLLADQNRVLMVGSGKMQMLSDLPPQGVNPTLDHYASGMNGSAVLHDTEGQEVLASAALVPLTG